MQMEYTRDHQIQSRLEHIIDRLGLRWLEKSRIVAIRSRGSCSRRTLARVHTISKVVQTGLGMQAHYFIEIISENFDRLSEEEKTKTLIHELMHIPKTMGGGFRHHRPYVTRKAVEKMYERYKSPGIGWFQTLSGGHEF